MAVVKESPICNCSCQLNQTVYVLSTYAVTGVRPNTAVKPKCVNGTFQCPRASHTGRLALNVYSS